jgi:hypothetical protein
MYPVALNNGAAMPEFQTKVGSDINQHAVISYSQGFSANAFNGTLSDVIQLKVERSSLPGPIREAAIRFRLTSTSTAVQLAATPYWVNRVELWQNSDREILRMHNDELFVWPLANTNAGRIRNLNKQFNLRQERDNLFATRFMPASRTDFYYLPLSSSFIDGFNLNLNYVSGDLYIRIYPAASPINTDGSTANTPTLGEIALVYGCTVLGNESKQRQVALHKQPRLHYVLHPVPVPTTAQAYAASTTYNQTLEAVSGKCPLMLWALRASSSNNSNNVLRNIDLGDNATHQITTPGGADLLYNGSPMRLNQITDHMSQQLINGNILDDRNWYITCFSTNVGASLLGKIDGFVQMNGDRFNHVINTGSAGTACVHTITQSQALQNSSSYRIKFGHSISNDLAFNATAGAMQTAANAMQSALLHPQGPLNFTFDQAASAGATVNCTITGPNGSIVSIEEPVQFIYDNGTAATATTASTAITTYAFSGFPSGGTYQLILYAYVIAEISLDTNGNLRRRIL